MERIVVKMPRKPAKAVTARSEHAELLGEIMALVEPHWDAKRFDKLTYPRLGFMLRGLKKQEISYLKRVAGDSKDFSKTFFWMLKEYRAKKV